MTVRPRQLVHRGSVEASALLLDPGLLGEARARQRVIAAWCPGATLYRLDGSYLLRWPGARRTACDQTVGVPLVAAGDRLEAAPLTRTERAALPSGEVIHIRGGVAIASDPGERLDPAAWLDVDSFETVDVASLGAPPPPAVLALPPHAPDARAALGDEVPAEAPQRGDLVAALQQAMQQRETTALQPRGPGLFQRLLGRLVRTAPRDGPTRQPTGWWDRAGHALRRRLASLAVRSRLSWVLGRRQGRYLAEMMEMFEKGDLAEALRHAIPLGGGKGAQEYSPSLGVPSPRSDLSIRRGAGGGTIGYLLGDDTYQLLQHRYAEAARQLEREGRIPEAAFVLAELLGDGEGAVALLERYERFTEAADLAETLELAAGLVVRQWILAGDIDRAVAIARRTGAFGDAVVRLEQRQDPRAAELRVLWAESLARAGDHLAAVRAIWSLKEARDRARPWLDQGMEAGGRAGAELMALQLEGWPDAFDRVLEHAGPLLEDRSSELAMVRVALARALEQARPNEAVGTLARHALRSVLADRGEGHNNLSLRRLRQLARRTGEPVMAADLPVSLGALPPHEPTLHRVDRADRGALPVHDAAWLPSGQLVLALGDLGLRFVSRSGGTAAHLDVPATRLVVSDGGTRAIAAIQRGKAWQLGRVDLVTRKHDRWVDAELGSFAGSFDGSAWFVSQDDALVMLDVEAAGLAALWRVSDLPGVVARVSRREGALDVVMRGVEVQHWSYRLPELTLSARREIAEDTLHPAQPFDLCADGHGRGIAYRRVDSRGSFAGAGVAQHLLGMVQTGWARRFPAAQRLCGALAIRGPWLVVPLLGGDGVDVHLLDPQTGSSVTAISLEGASRVATREFEDRLVVADDRGRVVVMETPGGRVLRDLRIGG